MTDIFLSYNREDQAVARRFAEAFSAAGFDVWWDASLKSGEAYDEVTETALRSAKAVVVLWSPRSVVSRWVRAEATLADRSKTLVPCTIEACDRPIMFELTQTADLSHWMGDPTDKVWQAFLGDVRRFVGKAAHTVAPAEAAPPPPLRGERGGRPSLAILPFTNRSGLPEDEVFAIGMGEDVIDALSQGVNVRVLASSATAGFRKSAITDLPAVGRQLGVRYLLEGNVRRVGATLRVTSQLVEAASSAILWTQKFERPLPELAALQEDLVLEVAAHLDTQVQRLEMERALRKPADLTAWEAVTRSIASFRQISAGDVSFGIKEAERAVQIAPGYGAAHALVAMQNGLKYFLFVELDPALVCLIDHHIERALVLEPDNAIVLGFVAQALNMTGRPTEALPRAERAIHLSPCYGYAHFVAALSSSLLGRTQAALEHLDADSRTAPGSHLEYVNHFYRAFAHMRSRAWDAALTSFDLSIAINPDASHGYAGKAAILGLQGRKAEAVENVLRARRVEPDATIDLWDLRYGRIFVGSVALAPLRDSLRSVWAETYTIP